LGAEIVGEDRLKAEPKLAVLGGGEETMDGAGLGGEAVVELAKLPKSSAENRSIELDGAGGLGAAAACGAARPCGDMKPVPKAEPGEVTADFATGAVDGMLSKKPPPLRGGGEVICGADGVDFAGTALAKAPNADAVDEACTEGEGPNADAVEEACTGGDIAGLGLEKFIPPNASARPPKASCFAMGGEVIPPNDG
jgi:hypothetical protein